MAALKHKEHIHWNPWVKAAAGIPTCFLTESFRLEETFEIIKPNPNATCNYYFIIFILLLLYAIILHKISHYFVLIYHLSFHCAQHLRVHLMCLK